MHALFVLPWNNIGPNMQRDSIDHFVRAARFRTGYAAVECIVADSVGLPGPLQGRSKGRSSPAPSTARRFRVIVLPQECANSDVRELNRDGSVRRVIARPLTQDELRARALEAKKRLEEEDKQLAQRRRDKSLLEAYASDEEIEAARAKSLESATQSMARAKPAYRQPERLSARSSTMKRSSTRSACCPTKSSAASFRTSRQSARRRKS